MTESPLILVIDDSPTIRKAVETYLSEAGYRVALAADADRGVALAASDRPDLILLDHQLPGTTGDDVCRRLLADEATARTPVLISSALRNRAFALYADYPNVIDQVPKPYTAEALRAGVANALATGSMVVQAQRTGCAMPESLSEGAEPTLQGHLAAFPLRGVLDFLNHAKAAGRVTAEAGGDRIRFALGSGRVQAVYSPTFTPGRLRESLPAELIDLGPLLLVTLGEHQDASTSGLVRLLEQSLTDPRRLRLLLRAQAAVLTYRALTGEPGAFTFEPGVALPPMFGAFPLQLSLPALAAEGARRCVADGDRARLGPLAFARQTPRGGNVDRSGLSPAEVRLYTLLDGVEPLSAAAAKAGLAPAEAGALALGLELAGQVERRGQAPAPAAGDDPAGPPPAAPANVLLLEDDVEAAGVALRALGPAGEGLHVRHVRDRVAARLLVRRGPFALILLPAEGDEQGAFCRQLRAASPAATRFVGLAAGGEPALDRLEEMGLDGVLHRPLREADVRATVRQLLGVGATAVVA